jgi:hypothetical protein
MLLDSGSIFYLSRPFMAKPLFAAKPYSISVIEVRFRWSLELALEQTSMLGDAAVHSFAPKAKT